MVDDDTEILTAVSLYLSQFGYGVVTAKSGGEALRQAQLDPPDVMLVDLIMPGMSGAELMVRLRETGVHVPIIVITADTDAARKLRAGSRQAILVKPFNFADMREAIERAAGHELSPVRRAADGRQ